MSQPYKKCKCGRSYSKKKWRLLPFLGNQFTDGADGVFKLELRNCPCRSTIGVEFKMATTWVRTEDLPKGS